ADDIRPAAVGLSPRTRDGPRGAVARASRESLGARVARAGLLRDVGRIDEYVCAPREARQDGRLLPPGEGPAPPLWTAERRGVLRGRRAHRPRVRPLGVRRDGAVDSEPARS